MALIDLKQLTNQTKLSFYSKIYDYVFRDLQNVWLMFDNPWLCNDFQCVIGGTSLDVTGSIWWGSILSTWPNTKPLLTEMRINIPKNIYLDKCKKFPALNVTLDISKIACSAQIKVAIGEAIYHMINMRHKFKITLAYETKTLLEVKSLEEFNVALDLF